MACVWGMLGKDEEYLLANWEEKENGERLKQVETCPATGSSGIGREVVTVGHNNHCTCLLSHSSS